MMAMSSGDTGFSGFADWRVRSAFCGELLKDGAACCRLPDILGQRQSKSTRKEPSPRTVHFVEGPGAVDDIPRERLDLPQTVEPFHDRPVGSRRHLHLLRRQRRPPGTEEGAASRTWLALLRMTATGIPPATNGPRKPCWNT